MYVVRAQLSRISVVHKHINVTGHSQNVHNIDISFANKQLAVCIYNYQDINHVHAWFNPKQEQGRKKQLEVVRLGSEGVWQLHCYTLMSSKHTASDATEEPWIQFPAIASGLSLSRLTNVDEMDAQHSLNTDTTMKASIHIRIINTPGIILCSKPITN